jgi:hypothetical protein
MSIILQLHLFALGPQTRKMCKSRRPHVVCSKLSDYDDLCERVSEQHNLKGFYRAFMSSSTQWLCNFFADVCTDAKIINMHVNFCFVFFRSVTVFLVLRDKLCLIHLKICSKKNQHKMKFWMHKGLDHSEFYRYN